MDWHTYFSNLASEVSKKSKDTSTKVGAVIVGPDKEIRSTGYNDLPRGVNDDPEVFKARRERPEKYMWTEHAERNAIYNAARHGTSLDGCSIYLNVGGAPCADCTRAIIQSGIKKIYVNGHTFKSSGDWDKSTQISRTMAEEAGVEILNTRYLIAEINNE